MIVDDVQFVSLLIIAVPFVLWGMYGFSIWITTLIKIRRGFFEVRWIEKNHQEKARLVKPISNNIEIDKKPYPFSIDPDFFILRGAKKIIEFTKLGDRLQQIRFTIDKAGSKAGEPPEDLFNSMLLEAEQVGKILSFKKDVFMRLLAIIAAAGAIGAIIGIIFLVQQINYVPGIILNSTNQIPALTVEKIVPLIPKANPFNLTGVNITVIP